MSALEPLALNGSGYTLLIIPTAIALRDKTITTAKTITVVNSEVSKESAIAAASLLKGLVKDCEDCRKEIKTPVLAIGADIDAKARDFKHPAEQEIARLEALAGAFVAEQRRTAERQRQEQFAKEQAERAAEQARIDAIAAAEKAAAQAKGKAARAAAEAEAERLRNEALQAEIDKAEAEPVAPIETPKAEGANVVTNFEIFTHDLAALYKAYPHCVELKPKLNAIKDIAKHLHRSNLPIEIPGVEVSVIIGVNAKATRSNLAIQ